MLASDAHVNWAVTELDRIVSYLTHSLQRTWLAVTVIV